MSQYNPSDPYNQGNPQGYPQGYPAYDPAGQPPYPPGDAAYLGYAPPKPKRPTSITVIAVFAIILGAIGLCGAIMQVVQVVAGKAFEFGGPNPVNDLMRNDPFLSVWNIVTVVVGSILGLLLLVGGIASLSLKEWARKSLLIYAVGTIIFGLIGVVVNFAVVVPRMASLPQDRPEVQLTVKLMPWFAVGGLVIGLILPVCILIFMTRPRVKAAFAGLAFPGGPGNYPPGAYPPGAYPPGAYPPPGSYPPGGGYTT